MSTPLYLKDQIRKIIGQIAELPAMRRGTLRPFTQTRQRKDGTLVQRGPYWRYTRKQKGKTVGRHIGQEALGQLYEQQIQTFRRFERLCEQLVETSEKMADLIAEKKGPWNRPSRSASRPSGSGRAAN